MRRIAFLLYLCVASATAEAAEMGALGGAWIGPKSGHISTVLASSITTYATLSTADRGWAYRFIATDTKDIKTVYAAFSAISSPGTIECRIETVDASTGKPTGTLYDANATVSLTPGGTGWVAFTFASLPTTGLTVGTQYAIVLLSGGGTTCTLYSSVGSSDLGIPPYAVLTSGTSAASTRSNFAEVSAATGVCYAIMDDDQVYGLGACNSVAVGSTLIYGADIVAGVKITLPVDTVVRGVATNTNIGFLRVGTPAGDLRCRILDASNSTIVSATVPKASVITSRGCHIPLPLTTLAAGTYRVVFDSAGSANSSNCYALRYATLPDGKLQGTGFCHTDSANASSTFTWTDAPTKQLEVGLILDSLTASGSSNFVDPLGGGPIP